MTTSHGPIKCGACGSIVATVSENGLALPPSIAQIQSCSLCDQLRPLYDAMTTADELYASMAGRRDTYGPKQTAFADVKRTHREFSNLLARVEESTAKLGEGLPEGQRGVGNEAELDKNEEEIKSTKRPRSHSSNIAQDIAASKSGGPTNTHPLPKSKRLKFSESVEFRGDYRPCNSYARSNEAYVRGRYAPPDGGEHLDTSGSEQSFLKFTGMKKVGKKWVDVRKDDSDEDSTSAQANHVRTTDAEDEGPATHFEDAATQPEAVPPNARAESLARSKSAADTTMSSTVDVVSRLDDLNASSNIILQADEAASAFTEGMEKTDPESMHALEKSLSQPQLNTISTREDLAMHNVIAKESLTAKSTELTMHPLAEVRQDTPKLGHIVEEHFPIRVGSANTGKLHLQGKESDSRDMMLDGSWPGMDEDTSYFGLYGPEAGKQESTSGVVEHTLNSERSPRFRESSFDHTNIAADGHSPWTTHLAASEDPYREHSALSPQDKRPTADED